VADIKNPKLIWAKGGLFLLLALLSAALILAESPRLEVWVLLAVSIWSFCRFYYFVFYVIEHYIDPTYRFSGLVAFLLYALRKGRGGSR
jgi:hypothetical protein